MKKLRNRIGLGLFRRAFDKAPLTAFCAAAALPAANAGSAASHSGSSMYAAARDTVLKSSIAFSIMAPERSGFYRWGYPSLHQQDTTPASKAFVPEEFAPSLFDEGGGFQLRYAEAAPAMKQSEAAVASQSTMPLLDWLRRWKFESEEGIRHTFENARWQFALGYTDIFETHSNPEKGGHGLALFFRYEFGRSKASGANFLFR